MAAQQHIEHVAGLRVESSETPAKPDDYVIVNGYRLVKPYHFDFCCSVRQRWFGQSIIEIFSREFPARDRQYYLQALADGRLRVEGAQVGPDTPLRDGQRMRHFIHRHEPPVPAGPIPLVGQSQDVVAVCKPHGMPVHVAGQYRKNTVLGVLTAERPDLGQLYPIHRLDKPVSGLLLFARSSAAAAALCQKIESREVEKVYVARVLGRFPASEEPIVADVPLAWDPVSNNATAVPEAAEGAEAVGRAESGAAEAEAAATTAAAVGVADAGSNPPHSQQQQQQAGGGGGAGAGVVSGHRSQQQQPADSAAALAAQRQQRRQVKKQQKAAKAERQAAARAAAEAAAKKPSRGAAKPALTEFKLLAEAEDGLTSIVECRPRTGRTHQIRVHLQYLGHPIANDTQYGGTYGGPMASRQMAQQLGVHWASAAAAGEEEGAAGAGASGAAAAAASPAAECSKRPRLDAQHSSESGALDASAAALPAAQPAAAAAQPAAAEPAAGIAAPAAAGDVAVNVDVDVDVYAQNQAFRSRPEYQVAGDLRDSMCIHCPFYAPRDYPLDLRPLWLHARSYSCQEDGWSFSAQLPEWAQPGWQPPAPPPSGLAN